MDVPDWSRWEQLIADRGAVIERPRGHAHPLYPDMIYPCDYLSRVDASRILAFLDRGDPPPGLDLVWRSGR